MRARRIVILTEGHSNPHTAKTACSVLRYRTDEVEALLDSTHAGETTGQVLHVGGETPIVGSLDDVRSADTLLIGIAPPGGKIPTSWRSIVLQAIARGMDVVSGLHDYVSADAEFTAAARRYQVELVDLRKNSDRDIALHPSLRTGCVRVLTVGHDCSVGKMVTSLEVTRELQRRRIDAKFLATGQTGMLLTDAGCPVDSVVADFVSGSVERLIVEHQQHDVLILEGQGSLVHPSYSGVTLSLLHGSVPHGLILCYEVGRTTVTGISHLKIPPLAQIKDLNEKMANAIAPCRVIAISMNSRRVNATEAAIERQRREEEFGVPVSDVFRDGPSRLADAVLKLRDRLLGDQIRGTGDE